MNNYEDFNNRLELFLKKKLSPEEEALFISELKQNDELRETAQVMALAISEMGSIRAQKDKLVISGISALSKEDYFDVVWSTDKLDHFDELTNRFLKKQLTAEEEQQYIGKLQEIPALRKRAQVIALTVEQMGSIIAKQNKDIIGLVANMSESQFRNAAIIPAKVIPLWPRITRYAAIIPAKIPLWLRITRYAAAACIVVMVGFGGFKYYQYDQTISLGATYYQQYDLGPSRGGDVDFKTLTALFDNVEKSEDLKGTITSLEKYYNSAISDKLSDYAEYEIEIGWNLTIAYLKDNNRKDAIKTLESIIERHKDKDIAKKAQELLYKVKKI